LDVLPKQTKDALLHCAKLSLFKEGGWYLAGGTALALQVGHRESVDLDFFTSEKAFDERHVIEQLSESGSWRTNLIDTGTVYGELLGAKVSLIAYPSFKAAEPMREDGSIRILTPPDISAMKVVAISQRGRKRDFYDLYWLSQNILPLSESIERAQRQYTVPQNLNHILKSLVYFADAEDDPEPVLHFKAKWKEVKEFFKKEISQITARLIQMP